MVRWYLLIITGQVATSEGVLARRLFERALVHVELAEHALPGGWTVANEAVLAVYADTAILARLRTADAR